MSTVRFDRPVFVYADVPYRISDRADMIRDPRSTITFLDDRAAAVERREAAIGTLDRLASIQPGLKEYCEREKTRILGAI